MNSTSRRHSRRQTANPQPTYKVRLVDGTMAEFPTFSRAAAVAAAIAPNRMAYRDSQPGYILIP